MSCLIFFVVASVVVVLLLLCGVVVGVDGHVGDSFIIRSGDLFGER